MVAARAVFELQDVPASDLWETIRRGSRLISSKVGLIRRIDETRYQAQDPRVFCTGVVAADFARLSPSGLGVKAGGAGADAASAVASAIAETAERHCACFYERDTLVLGSFRELAPDAVAPELLRLFSREQLAAAGAQAPAFFDEDARTRWVWGYSLSTRKPRLVPAALVYMTYRPEADEARIAHSASTGLSAGLTREEAILGGLLEIVERDAFTLAWLHRHAGRRIVVDDDALADEARARLWSERPSVDVKFFDITTDTGIPVVFVVMRRATELGPVACVGASARLSPRRALHKCILEAGQNFPYLRYLMDGAKGWEPAPDFSNVASFDQHFLTYVRRPDLVAPAFAFWDECPDRVALSALPDSSTGRVLGDIEHCVARLAEAGYEAIVVDITTPDIAEVGFSVVRVVVPGLLPLHGHHLHPYLGVRRLHEAPQRLGWPTAGLNPFPHPFP
jgi:ribosomal protein S12 methylthiotransferase accessory factor